MPGVPQPIRSNNGPSQVAEVLPGVPSGEVPALGRRETLLQEGAVTLKPQTRKVLQFMQEHGSITSFDAYERLGCHRLAARIHEIREAGYGVKCETKTGKNRFGEMVCFTNYSLEENAC